MDRPNFMDILDSCAMFPETSRTYFEILTSSTGSLAFVDSDRKMLYPLVGLTAGTTSLLFVLAKAYCPWVFEDFKYIQISKKIKKSIFECLSNGKFMVDIFEEKVKENPGKTFIIYHDQNYSYGYVNEKANRAARAAMELGLNQGDVVAIMIKNEPAFIWTYIGLMKAGLPIAMINFNLRSRSLAHCILTSEAKILIVGEGQDLLEASTEILDQIPGVGVYWMSTKSGEGKFKSYGSLMDSVSGGYVDRSVRNKVGFYSTCVYIYTSGTTGLPKPAIVPQVRMVVSSCTWRAFDMAENDVTYITLPLYHSAGLLLGVGNTITAGATLVLRDKFSASHFWEDCKRHNVTVIQYIGEICRYLVARPKDEKDGKHSIRVAYGNGLRADIWTEFQTRFKIPNILEFYGATEAPIGFCNYSNVCGSCGRSSPLLRRTNDPAAFVKFDLDTQAPVRDKNGRCIPIKPGDVGLAIVPLSTGRASFQGYKGNKEATEKKLLRNVFQEGDVYFNTGDLFRVDTSYYLYFNDRVGDTFRWKGENVSTTEVSNVVSELDFIHDTSIYGVTIPGCEGRAGMASIHLKDPNQDQLSPAMLMKLSKHCNEALPAYARPRFIRVQKELDLTSTFKQSKENLKQEGFDITKIKDPLYYLHPTTNAYFPLDQTIYYQIIAGNIPM